MSKKIKPNQIHSDVSLVLPQLGGLQHYLVGGLADGLVQGSALQRQLKELGHSVDEGEQAHRQQEHAAVVAAPERCAFDRLQALFPLTKAGTEIGTDTGRVSQKCPHSAWIAQVKAFRSSRKDRVTNIQCSAKVSVHLLERQKIAF